MSQGFDGALQLPSQSALLFKKRKKEEEEEEKTPRVRPVRERH